jgi:uncharacterized coiled-coil DUF342 family protein
MIIFLSFSSQGMHPVPAGFVGNTQELNITQYSNSYFSFLKLTEYADIDSCIKDIKSYKQYLCINAYDDGLKLQLGIYYDNTREPIIWQVIERIQFNIDLFQKQQSTQITSKLLGSFGETADKVDAFRSNFVTYDDKINIYITDITSSQQKLGQVQNDLRNTIYSMDRDISEARTARSELADDKDNFYNNALSSSSQLDHWANTFPANSSSQYDALYQMKAENNEIRNKIYDYNYEANSKLGQFDSKLSSYEYTSQRSKQYINEIDTEVLNLEDTKRELEKYKTMLEDADQSVGAMSESFRLLSQIKPGDVINPFTIKNIPTYIPDIDENKLQADKNTTTENSAKELSEGINLLGLQTIYPTVVFLILLFLSLLISTFITLNYINSSSNTRISLLKGVVFSEIFALYLSSLSIVIIPMLCILAVGELLFMLPIFVNIIPILIIIILVSSSFIFLGMILSHIIKKESITLLLMTFLLVLFTFFSGFVLPIERMSIIPGEIARNSPSNIGLEAFKIIVFYNNTLGTISEYIKILLITLSGLLIILVAIKYLKR